MNLKENNDQFQFQFLDQHKVTEYSQNLAKVFSVVQPCYSCQISCKKMAQLSRQIIKASLKDKLSIGLRHKRTKLLAGCLITTDLFYDQQLINKLQNNRELKQFQPIFYMLESIQQQYFQEHNVYEKPGLYAHMWLEGVFQGFKGRGLSHRLLDQTMLLLKQRKYKYAVCELTSPYTIQTLINSSKYFERVKSIKYKDFQYEDKRPFENVNGQVVFARSDIQHININSSRANLIV